MEGTEEESHYPVGRTSTDDQPAGRALTDQAAGRKPLLPIKPFRALTKAFRRANPHARGEWWHKPTWNLSEAFAQGKITWDCPMEGCNSTFECTLPPREQLLGTEVVTTWSAAFRKSTTLRAIRVKIRNRIAVHRSKHHPHWRQLRGTTRNKALEVTQGSWIDFTQGGWMCPYCEPASGFKTDQLGDVSHLQLTEQCRRHAREEHQVTDWKKWKADCARTNTANTIKFNGGRRMGWHAAQLDCKKRKANKVIGTLAHTGHCFHLVPFYKPPTIRADRPEAQNRMVAAVACICTACHYHSGVCQGDTKTGQGTDKLLRKSFEASCRGDQGPVHPPEGLLDANLTRGRHRLSKWRDPKVVPFTQRTTAAYAAEMLKRWAINMENHLPPFETSMQQVREVNEAAAAAICSAAPTDYVEAKGRLRYKQREPPMRKALRIYKLCRPTQKRRDGRDAQDEDRSGNWEGIEEPARQKVKEHPEHNDEGQ